MADSRESKLLVSLKHAADSGNRAAQANAWDNLARYYHEHRNAQRALGAYQKALELWRALFGPRHPVLAPALLNMGSLLLRERKLQAARLCLHEALEIYEQDVDFDDPNAVEVLRKFEALLPGEADRAEAQSWSERVARLSERLWVAVDQTTKK